MQNNKNIVKAINRNVRSSPRKINLLLKNIRGKKADIAIRDLSFARQRIAFDIKKTLQSAVANAENNNQFDIDNLYVKKAFVDEGAKVAFCARDAAMVSTYVDELSNQGATILGSPVDITDRSSLEAFIHRAAEVHGGIDAVVPNVSALVMPMEESLVLSQEYIKT